MKQSVGMPGRLASAQFERVLRRKRSGIAENTFVSIRSGGRSRYIIGSRYLRQHEPTINDDFGGVSPPKCYCCKHPRVAATRRESALRSLLVRRTNNVQQGI